MDKETDFLLTVKWNNNCLVSPLPESIQVYLFSPRIIIISMSIIYMDKEIES